MNTIEAAERFVAWIDQRLTAAGRGDHVQLLDIEPSGRFWLGRLAPEEAVLRMGLGERGERLDPCAVGIRFLTDAAPPWDIQADVSCRLWLRDSDHNWVKSEPFVAEMNVHLTGQVGEFAFKCEVLDELLLGASGSDAFSSQVRAEVRLFAPGQYEISTSFVNTSNPDADGVRDKNLYECGLAVGGPTRSPYVLTDLEDSFRYDRSVEAYGINCGVSTDGAGRLVAIDVFGTDTKRPVFWSQEMDEPDLSFATLAADPVPSLQVLVGALGTWGRRSWSASNLDHRAAEEGWSEAMRAAARTESATYFEEVDRIADGVELLASDPVLRASFEMMNEAMGISSDGRFDSWRPFQLGFLLSTIGAITDRDADAEWADVLWFATGGGKTETYLGLIVTAAFYDRLEAVGAGITAWSRFPLRMLSLQQTQRFANALAAAELVRRSHDLAGDQFAVGFLVGQGGTPNKIPVETRYPSDFDVEDDDAAAGYQVLLQCPFCRASSIEMGFDRVQWRLEHRCGNNECPWIERALPFYIVDDEIYRFLPTVVVGTLDKAASISMQAAMRGFVGPPLGRCSIEGHGYVYAGRSGRPHGCLVPGCSGVGTPLPDTELSWGIDFRLQDELHLLRDSLGAVDSHYEALFDHLQAELTGRKPKVLGSSATLSGTEHQIRAIYGRTARVFPTPAPSAHDGFWTRSSSRLARRYVAIAPRGVTLEYAVDRILTELQQAIRDLVDDPVAVCSEIGVDPEFAPTLVSLYGVSTVYANTTRDLEASLRSVETQVLVDGPVNTATLTGRTDFEEVRETLGRLEEPESEFTDRIHVLGATAMMSHGVDIDRLNVMVMLGLPLATAEFIQATARVGRTYPGIVLVLPKIARERDAGVYRAFDKFVEHGDRFVEAVPVTRYSRQVLQRTIAGIELARVLMLHEPRSGTALTTVRRLREFVRLVGLTDGLESQALIDVLSFDGPLDDQLRADTELWMDTFFSNLMDPAGDFRFPSDLSPTGKPMRSLRDVEEQVPIIGFIE